MQLSREHLLAAYRRCAPSASSRSACTRVLRRQHSRLRASLCRRGGLRRRRLHASRTTATASPAPIAATATASPRAATCTAMMEEIFGRKDGLCGGKGGSMHIADLSKGMLGANGIVGGGPPLICGAALDRQDAQDRRRRDRLRRRRRLQPGHHAREPTTSRRSGTCRRSSSSRTTATPKSTASNWSVGGSQVGARQGLRHARPCEVDGSDFFAVYEAAREAIERARAGGGPSLIHAQAQPLLRPFRGRRARPTARPTRSRSARRDEGPADALPPARDRGRRCSRARQLDAIDTRGQAERIEQCGRDGQGGADADRGRSADRRLRPRTEEGAAMAKKTYRQAINEALRQEMERDPRVILMGEDIAGGMGAPGEQDAWGGPLGVTKGLMPQVRARPRARHADHRERLHRRRRRRRGDRPAAGGRADVRRFHGRLLRPDLQPGRQVPLHVRRQGGDAAGDPHHVRRRLPRRLRSTASASIRSSPTSRA